MSKQGDLLSAVQEAYRLLWEAKAEHYESASAVYRLAARRLLEDVVGRIGEEGELK